MLKRLALAAILCGLLCQPALTATAKQRGLLILIHVANSGRVFREMICEGVGVDLLVQSMLNDQNEKTLELYGSLFMDLGMRVYRWAASMDELCMQ